MELDQERVQYDLEAGVAWIMLAVPQMGNVLSYELLTELSKAIRAAEANTSCRVIVLTAAGSDFCRGIDMGSLLDTQHSSAMLLELLMKCLLLIANARQPVIASVSGQALGGGVGLVAACDIVFSTDSATFMLPEGVVGMIPAIITPFLLRRLSPARVQYLTLSTHRLEAAEACCFGLVDKVCSTDKLDDALQQQLRRVMKSSPRAMEAAKRYFWQLDEGRFERQVALALETARTWIGQPEVLEGIDFTSKGESPSWFHTERGRQNV